ncbi:MAG TPA: TIM barrel protein [Verrucomicrobiae bacterium]|jgi:sugar phosphate isomerase/epimerase|nr:TIM barrel protein [Verrucomicrobiae bacterium]
MSMELQIFKTLWGHTSGFDVALAACKENEFDGLEGPVPSSAVERSEFNKKLSQRDLSYIAEICTAGSYVPNRQATDLEHLDSFLRQAEAALECEPLFLNVIAGCDAWSIEQSVEFFGRAMTISEDLGIIASFETHRSRSFFNPWVTRDILRQLPALKLTCDFSHWCVVCERLIDTEPDVIALCAERAHHVHARVGYDQGAQVPHPAAPEHREALEAHERWWAQIWRSQIMRGLSVSTMTPEFGPDGYLHCLPFTGAPVADLEQINAWMAERQRRRFAEWIGTANQLNPATITN